MGKMNGWYTGKSSLRASEQRRQQPESRSVPARKNTKRWCRGKVGTEHQPAVTMGQSWGRVCGKDQSWSVRRRALVNVWRCYHEMRCSQCGKVVDRSVERCPDRPKKETEC